jgi:hypothetical protein
LYHKTSSGPLILSLKLNRNAKSNSLNIRILKQIHCCVQCAELSFFQAKANVQYGLYRSRGRIIELSFHEKIAFHKSRVK